MAITFEGYERRINQINKTLNEYGIKDIEEAKKICDDKGIDVYNIVKSTQPICFENACWAYTVGAAIAIKKGDVKAADAAKTIGIGLQSFCIPGSVADDRKVGLGHGNLGSRLLDEETQCFAFLAGHESFAAAEGAIKIALNANKVRKHPLRVILNGLGKDAAKIISRIMVSHMLKLSSIISQVRLKNYLELLIQMVTELRLTAMVQMTYVKV